VTNEQGISSRASWPRKAHKIIPPRIYYFQFRPPSTLRTLQDSLHPKEKGGKNSILVKNSNSLALFFPFMNWKVQITWFWLQLHTFWVVRNSPKSKKTANILWHGHTQKLLLFWSEDWDILYYLRDFLSNKQMSHKFVFFTNSLQVEGPPEFGQHAEQQQCLTGFHFFSYWRTNDPLTLLHLYKVLFVFVFYKYF
jgi:hypothetical protein